MGYNHEGGNIVLVGYGDACMCIFLCVYLKHDIIICGYKYIVSRVS